MFQKEYIWLSYTALSYWCFCKCLVEKDAALTNDRPVENYLDDNPVSIDFNCLNNDDVILESF